MNETLGGRFVLEQLVARGGMGTVYRGRDMRGATPVAIKLFTGSASHASRLERESTVLAQLCHPAIVRYVAHGLTHDGEPFLVMEWLEGEDLATRLAREPLDVVQTLALAQRVSEALVAAHLHGVVHRDLKPSNLFLVDRRPDAVKLLDFGIARWADAHSTLTQSGAVLGSVGYMSPEQAMGAEDIDARSDLFALGCVLYECLTGRAAFAGPSAVAVLAKVLRDEPVRAIELRPRLDRRLDMLVARLLAKQPQERPQSAEEVLAVLAELREATESAPPLGLTFSSGLTGVEQRVASVVLAVPRQARDGTPTMLVDDPALAEIRALTTRLGTEPITLRTGGLLIVVSDRGVATDQATQAASCALALRKLRPDLRLSVASGQAETRGRMPVGEAIDRAASLVQEPASITLGIAMDALTAALLPSSFEVRSSDAQHWLVDEIAELEPARLLLGKPTPFVGRDRELGMLELTLTECADDGVARAVVVTGPPGQGKSRLRQEFLARVRQRGDTAVWLAQGSPVGAGSSLGFLRQILRQGFGLGDADPVSDQRAAVYSHVAFASSSRLVWPRSADFLCELIGLPRSRALGPELKAASSDPAAMNVWLRRTFCEWVDAESMRRPLLVVLDDLHWGDAASVEYLCEALREARQRPIMLLALGRAEMRDLFPKHWMGVEPIELSLGRLTSAAARRLVQGTLGELAVPGMLTQIVERADGNPFYLEELVRHAALASDAESAPESVIALVQSRLEQLPPQERWLARAGSVFGEMFWRGGLAALLGPNVAASELEGWLRALTEREVVSAAPRSRFASEPQYVFCHSLLRDAAYAMLTDEDRVRGHRLAGTWLEQAGESDSLTLAHHFERGHQATRAIAPLTDAAFRALDSGNLEGTVALIQRAQACGLSAEQSAGLERMRAAVLLQGGDLEGAVRAGEAALAALPPGRSPWFVAAGNLFLASAFLGDTTRARETLQTILTTPVVPPVDGAYGWLICVLCSGLVANGRLRLARDTLSGAMVTAQPYTTEDPSLEVGLGLAEAAIGLFSGELALAHRRLHEAATVADRLGLATQRAVARYLLVGTYAELGNLDRLEEQYALLNELCTPAKMRFYPERASTMRASALSDAGRGAEVLVMLRPLLDRTDALLRLSARAAIAYALLSGGDDAGAEQSARQLVEESSAFPVVQLSSLGLLARIALRRREPADALACVQRALGLGAEGMRIRDRAQLWLSKVEALRALRQQDAAQAQLDEASALLHTIARSLPEPALAAAFLAAPVNARLLELAESARLSRSD